MVYNKKQYVNVNDYFASNFRAIRQPAPEVPEASPLPKPTNNKPPFTDAEGLRRAYEQGDAYPYKDTLYIAGSHTLKDWYDDVTKIPFYGDLKQSTRYRRAENALKANPDIKRVVGHSLGGSVALELQKQYPNLQSQTYGAPVWDPLGLDNVAYDNWIRLGKPDIGIVPQRADRYRNWFDPVSVFDSSATRYVKWDPFNSFSLTHDYSNIAENFQPHDAQNSNRQVQ